MVERIGAGVYHSVGGFVTGNLLASLLAGVVATVIMLVAGVPYAVPLGLFVAIIELVPYVGPLVATIVVTAVALTVGLTSALVALALLLVYHAIEGHSLRPMLYGRAVKLSPLAVLVAILLGTEIAGILGALVAIPVAGSIQVLLRELLQRRDERRRSVVLGAT
jgi:predicted PurR-regulated permease PerM